MNFWSYRRRKILALFTFGALFFLLVLHVRWLFKAATFEEEIFNQRVAIAMKEARDEIEHHLDNGNDINNYLCSSKLVGNNADSTVTALLDSIITSRLLINNIHLKYTFNVVDNYYATGIRDSSGCYCQTMNGLLPIEGISINIEFPDRAKYMMSQIGVMFIISLLFIVFIASSFLIMLRLYNRERIVVARTTDFINNMVHEFNTPLSNIRLATALIRKKADGDNKFDDYLNIISKEHSKLTRHVDDILYAATSGNHTSEIVNIAQLTRNVVEQYQPSIEELGGTINYTSNDEDIKLNANSNQMETAIINLIDNAIKYSDSSPEISITLEKTNNKIRLSVADKGIGIARGDINHIFEQFYRVSSGDLHKTKGFGIGLYHVKNVVKTLGGKIHVDSTPGKGSNFMIELKLYK